MENSTETQLSRWYRNIFPTRVDIVGDYAGKELFAIHGDSLLLYSLMESRVDFSNGLQLLHAVHAVESLLSALQVRGCNFHVLWFKDHEHLASPATDSTCNLAMFYRLARTILIKHFQRHGPQFGFEFDSLNCCAFQNYLEKNAIHFFMCLDSLDFQRQVTENVTHFLSIMHNLTSIGYSIALINNIQFLSSKVYAWVFSPRSGINGPLPIQGVLHPLPELALGIEAVTKYCTPLEKQHQVSARDAICLTALCNVLVTDTSNTTKALAAAHVLHLCILKQYSLAARSCGVTQLDGDDESNFQEFLAKFSSFCIQLVRQMPDNLQWDAYDLMDGRILRQIYSRLKILKLPISIATEARKLAQNIQQVIDMDISAFIPSIQDDEEFKPHQGKKFDDQAGVDDSILPFSHPVMDKYLKSVGVATKEYDEPIATSKIFQEVSHWHNASVPIDSKQLPKKKGFFARKRDQRWMADTMAYSASLTSASGKVISPEIIITQPTTSQTSAKSKGAARNKEAEKQIPRSAKNKDKKNAQKGGRQKAIEEADRIKKGKLDEKSSARLQIWDQRCREFEAESSLKLRYTKSVRFLSDLSDQDTAVLGAEVSLYVCNVLKKLILDGRKKGKTGPELGLFAMLWSRVLETAQMPMSPECFNHLERLAKMVLVNLPPRVPLSDDSTKKRTLPFTSVSGPNTDPRVTMDPIQFQLEHCGPYLERGYDPAPDSRVPSFQPDAWQRDVLDAIDANRSLFVVAPTSAGKTFISFYAMKKVLQSSDDGVLVYVAPTKALVNQIAAEIQARFSKSYNHDGRSVWAIHTRDYRVNNPKGCQVLVTVPHILQIMLLSPSNAEKTNSWSMRIKRIIFDEVHCIGQAEDGVIWEQLLLLAPCPIIALSATVGNPLEFKAWLEESEQVKGVKMDMIVHSSRYSDLRKFMYEPPRGGYVFRGLTPLDGLPIPGLDEGGQDSSRFLFIHPVASLVNCTRGNLDDISLEPRDCLMLWRCMSKHQTSEFGVPDSLNPRHVFSATAKKADVTAWEKAIKKILLGWMKNSRSPFSAMRIDLLSTCPQGSESGSDEDPDSESETDEFGIKFKVTKKSLCSMALPLLDDLNSRGALPAILFNYDRIFCEETLFSLVNQLEKSETQWKESSPQWKKKIKDYDEWLKNSSKTKKEKRPSRPGKDDAGQSKLDMIRDEANKETSSWASFDPDAPLEAFSFANRAKLLDSELESHIQRLKEAELDPKFVVGLRRGLAVHHAGMNRTYRQVVEILFRKGFLRVVMATGTLALGLNMPCKTVVFFGDSVFLTTLNYLQAAGRAGRRGFDVLGNVVFTGMPRDRVLDIMSSRLPDLRGHFPLSTTLILRLLGLLHSTQNSEYAARATSSLLSQTRLYLGGPADKMAICHHVRFSIEYLRRQHLLSDDGSPLNFSGLVGHLYFTENSVFALHSLLAKGYLHELCAEVKKKTSQVLLKLMLVLSHIFCRIPVRHRRSECMEKSLHNSPSLVILPPLPERAEAILSAHNAQTLDIFKTYVATFVKQHLAESPDDGLPLSGIPVGAQEQSGLSILDHLPPTQLRSPFSALSGLTDDFSSIHDLCTTVRSGVFLEESAVPYIPMYPKDTANVPWNAYLYDFFKHGDMQALVRDNGIKKGDVWFLLKDFSLILATIVTSMTNFLKPDGDGLEMENVQDVDDVLTEIKDCKLGVAGEAETVETTAGPAKAAGKKPTRQKVIADSWEDDDADQEENLATGSHSRSSSKTSLDAPTWQTDGEESLQLVLLAFQELRQQFDDKFRLVWS
ncbi:hypothetical protein CDD82_3630 [Ophiocordyceps australis]|uniref:DEAD/DEAH box helicase n=1 Tax=Ophiocordyceps australis TaxID=1399860 RepID=A0A2C5ZM58_9HYPO|nr:hypothetical protein CDD82_3630 [Ophiocordyceps australis]